MGNAVSRFGHVPVSGTPPEPRIIPESDRNPHPFSVDTIGTDENGYVRATIHLALNRQALADQKSAPEHLQYPQAIQEMSAAIARLQRIQRQALNRRAGADMPIPSGSRAPAKPRDEGRRV